MSALPKIVIGALATTAAAWLLHGPLGLGERCAAQARIASNDGTAAESDAGSSSAASSGAAGDAGANPGADSGAGTAGAESAVRACQDKVQQAASAGTISFATGGSAVAGSSATMLDGVATALRGCSAVTVKVAGHTDAQGDAAANQTLSQRRAEAVVAELVRRGVPAAQLTARGYGESRPLDRSGAENNPRNRRIEFTVSAAGAATQA